MLSTLLRTRLVRRICSSRHEVSKFKSHNTIETWVKHELNHAMLYAKPCKALQRILIGIIDGMYYNVQWGGFFFGGEILKTIKMKNKIMMFFFLEDFHC